MHFFAHPGHDHSEMVAAQSPSSLDSTTIVMIVFSAVAVIGVAVAVALIAKKSKTQKSS